jgi:hypothetical protein
MTMTTTTQNTIRTTAGESELSDHVGVYLHRLDSRPHSETVLARFQFSILDQLGNLRGHLIGSAGKNRRSLRARLGELRSAPASSGKKM